MNIHIYGGDTFKKKIHTILDHGNIKFKIEDGEVIDLNSLSELEDSIKEYPHEIFLIDQNKIIEDDFITKYFKFLIPKDGIKKEFLDKYGVGDISLRSSDELLFCLVKRIESVVNTEDRIDLYEDSWMFKE